MAVKDPNKPGLEGLPPLMFDGGPQAITPGTNPVLFGGDGGGGGLGVISGDPFQHVMTAQPDPTTIAPPVTAPMTANPPPTVGGDKTADATKGLSKAVDSTTTPAHTDVPRQYTKENFGGNRQDRRNRPQTNSLMNYSPMMSGLFNSGNTLY